jgi:hypothetical protein
MSDSALDDPSAALSNEVIMLAWPMIEGSRPRTNLEPPGGELGEVAFRISAEKFCFWFAITLHCAEVWEL